MSGDPLANVTEPYQSQNPQDAEGFEEKSEEDKVDIAETAYELFSKQLESQFSAAPTTDNDPQFLNETLRNFNFDRMKDKGKGNCGYDHDVEVQQILDDVFDFVKTSNLSSANSAKNPQDSNLHSKRERYTVSDIISLWLRKKEPRQPTNVWR